MSDVMDTNFEQRVNIEQNFVLSRILFWFLISNGRKWHKTVTETHSDRMYANRVTSCPCRVEPLVPIWHEVNIDFCVRLEENP